MIHRKVNPIILFYLLLITFNVFSQHNIKASGVTYRKTVPIPVRSCWHHLDTEKETLDGISLIGAK